MLTNFSKSILAVFSKCKIITRFNSYKINIKFAEHCRESLSLVSKLIFTKRTFTSMSDILLDKFIVFHGIIFSYYYFYNSSMVI